MMLVHEGLPERGNVARVTYYDARFTRDCQTGEMLHGNI